VLLLLDFEKAYDRILWTFIEAVLRKRGFHEDFIRGVMSLYNNATSALIVNGAVGEDFELFRSVRQGYPLAPFLFIIVLDALGYMLED